MCQKNLQSKTHYILESQITKNDLRTHTSQLYPKHQIAQTMFTFEPIMN